MHLKLTPLQRAAYTHAYDKILNYLQLYETFLECVHVIVTFFSTEITFQLKASYKTRTGISETIESIDIQNTESV